MTSLRAYLILDDMDEEESETLREIAAKFLVPYHLVNTRNGKRLYSGILKDHTEINDFLVAMSSKNPIVIGLFKRNGLQYGQTEVVDQQSTYDKEGNELTPATYKIIGEPIYPFKESEYLDLMPDAVEYDEEGNEISRARPTEVKDLHTFSGWDLW